MTDETRSNLDARLQRHGFARDVHRGLAKGIGFLPVSDETKSMLTTRSGEVVAIAAETGVALANGAVVAGKGAVDAAREGYHAFEEKREEEAAAAKRPFSIVTAQPETPEASSPASPGPEGEGDLVERLERLGSLRAAGHLSDAEFEAAKARLLSDG
ncbi:SHOCT domain-containing protein [Cellulomonas fimi]|uniref:SHOCT domain-containing protein n=1 Tax=Cellulomonas fimi TaxID=1708 RepID=UPI00234C2BDB|nr:SHOCT domain-containing protein [Cellulomonas fimi]MDC7123147.1 SHOCT domain-containing protein [Cellulomonas fimi]